MQILSIRCGVTRNLGNYESAKLEVEAAPSDGQSSAELLVEVKDYLLKALPATDTGGAKSPLAGGKGNKSTGKKSTKRSTKKTAAEKAVEVLDAEKAEVADPPFDTDAEGNIAVGMDSAQDTTTGDGMNKPAEKAKPAKMTKDEARVLFAFVVNSKTLEELLKKFNEFRDPGLGCRAALTKKDWENAITKVQDCYKALTTSEGDANVMHDLVAAINSERNTAKK